MNISINYIILGILIGLLILELQLHYFVNDGIGPIFPVVTSYIDVMTSAPYPWNSALLVTIAVGVSNVILRTVEFSSTSDWILSALTAVGLTNFILSVYSQQNSAAYPMLFRHGAELIPGLPWEIFAILYLLVLLLLSYFSDVNESQLVQKMLYKNRPDFSPLRKEIETIQMRIGASNSKMSCEPTVRNGH